MSKEDRMIKSLKKIRKKLNLGVAEVLELASRSYEPACANKNKFMDRLEEELCSGGIKC